VGRTHGYCLPRQSSLSVACNLWRATDKNTICHVVYQALLNRALPSRLGPCAEFASQVEAWVAGSSGHLAESSWALGEASVVSRPTEPCSTS
jgi:hypothetical protein